MELIETATDIINIDTDIYIKIFRLAKTLGFANGAISRVNARGHLRDIYNNKLSNNIFYNIPELESSYVSMQITCSTYIYQEVFLKKNLTIYDCIQNFKPTSKNIPFVKPYEFKQVFAGCYNTMNFFKAVNTEFPIPDDVFYWVKKCFEYEELYKSAKYAATMHGAKTLKQNNDLPKKFLLTLNLLEWYKFLNNFSIHLDDIEIEHLLAKISFGLDNLIPHIFSSIYSSYNKNNILGRLEPQ